MPAAKKRSFTAHDIYASKLYRTSQPKRQKRGGNRPGYSSVARTRGAAVTGEMKYFDTELVAVGLSAVTTTWVAGTLKDPGTTIDLGDAAVATPGCLFAPMRSAALNGRIGREVKVLKVKVRGLIRVPAQTGQSAPDASTLVRCLLVMDQQTNAAAMTSAQLMNDAGNGSSTILSYQNPNNFGRFRVLKDKTMVVANLNIGNDTGATGGVIQAGTNIPFKFAVNFKKPLSVRFNSTNGGTVADIIDNSFHIVCGVNQAGYAAAISYYTRVAYKD